MSAHCFDKKGPVKECLVTGYSSLLLPMEARRNLLNMKESILIVDDDRNTCKCIAKALSGEYITYTASNGFEALEILSKHREIHIVLSDIIMPNMSGIELLEKIHLRGNNTIVILITGYSDTESILNSMRLGAYDYIAKPVNLNRLEVSIKNALEKIAS